MPKFFCFPSKNKTSRKTVRVQDSLENIAARLTILQPILYKIASKSTGAVPMTIYSAITPVQAAIVAVNTDLSSPTINSKKATATTSVAPVSLAVSALVNVVDAIASSDQPAGQERSASEDLRQLKLQLSHLQDAFRALESELGSKMGQKGIELKTLKRKTQLEKP